MEVRINKEIRDYTEKMYFGLSLRQFIFSLLAIVVAVGLYLGLNKIFGAETTSWLCMVGVSPFAAIGFIKYHGMTAEQFLWAYIKYEFLNKKELPYRSTNLYYELLKNKKERAKQCSENI